VQEVSERKVGMGCPSVVFQGPQGSISSQAVVGLKILSKSYNTLRNVLDKLEAGHLYEGVRARALQEVGCEEWFAALVKGHTCALSHLQYAQASVQQRKFRVHQFLGQGDFHTISSSKDSFYKPVFRGTSHHSLDLQGVELRFREKERRKQLGFKEHIAAMQSKCREFCFHFGAQRKTNRTRAIYKADAGTRLRACFLTPRQQPATEAPASTQPAKKKGKVQLPQQVAHPEGTVIAVLAGRKADKYWLVLLDDAIMKDTEDYVSDSLTGHYLEPDDDGEMFVLGAPVTLGLNTMICPVPHFEEEDDEGEQVFGFPSDIDDIVEGELDAVNSMRQQVDDTEHDSSFSSPTQTRYTRGGRKIKENRRWMD
jgi:hypothetical protein